MPIPPMSAPQTVRSSALTWGRGSHEQQPFQFIGNRSQAIGSNRYLLLYPKDKLARMLGDYPDRAEDVFALLQQVNNSDSYFHCYFVQTVPLTTAAAVFVYTMNLNTNREASCDEKHHLKRR